MSVASVMRPVTIERPAAVRIGPETTSEVGGFAVARGVRRALVVADPFNLARVDRLALSCRVETFDALHGEPDTTTLAAARAVADAFEPELIVGFGGGSAMDLAKLLAVLAGSTLGIEAVVGVDRTPPRRILLVQVPTTSGTGSEVGTRALVGDAATRAKLAVESTQMLADLALLDPAMTATLPPTLTAETGIDALAHCVEAFTSARAHPAIDLYAREGISLIGRYLPRAVRDGDDMEARTGLALAAMYGGHCLGPVNTTAGHAIAYPLGTRHGVRHGRANAIIFPHTLAFNAISSAGRTDEILSRLGLDPRPDVSVFDLADGFCRDLGIDMRLPDHADDDEIRAMASEAVAIRRLLDQNPRPVTCEDIVAIYRAAR